MNTITKLVVLPLAAAGIITGGAVATGGIAAAAPAPGGAEASVEVEATARVVWRRRPGTTPVVHAYAVNSCVDVPLCGSCLSAGRFEELPPPPADLGPYRRCRKCVAALGRLG